MKKYRARWEKITEHTVVKETAKQIVFLEKRFNFNTDEVMEERREKKQSEYQNWFDTWDEAHQFLIEKSEAKIRGLHNRMISESATLEKIKLMKESEA